VRHARGMNEVRRGRTIIDFTNRAAEAYSRIITRYPVKDRAGDAKKRLQALNRPAPTPTSAAIATSKKEEASRSETGTFGRIMGNFKHSPDVAAATKVGQPVLNVPEETSAVILARQIESDVNGQSSAGGSTVTLQQLKPGSVPENEPAPKSAPAPAASPATDQSAPSDTGIPEMQPIGASDSGKTTAAPVATAAPAAANAVSSAPTNPATATTDNKPDAPQPQSQSNGDSASKSPDSSSAQASQSDQSSSSDQGTSSSKKKKKKGLRKLVPF